VRIRRSQETERWSVSRAFHGTKKKTTTTTTTEPHLIGDDEDDEDDQRTNDVWDS
jgi:hypothetical protein